MKRLRDSYYALIRESWLQSVLTVIILWFLMTLAVVLGWVVQIADTTTEQLEQQLGFYFYLEERVDDTVWEWVLLQLTQDLESIGLDPVYYSKDQAFERLARSLPNVVDDLEKYDIWNPLPPTLYVPFADRESYELLRSIVVEYDDFITNTEELNNQVTFGNQERRIQSILSVSRSIQYTIMVILLTIVFVIGACIAYWNRSHLQQFSDQLALEKMLGASRLQRVLPFFCRTRTICVLTIVISAGLLAIVLDIMQDHLMRSSDQSFQWILETLSFWSLWWIGGVAVVVVWTVVTLGMMIRKHV